MAIFYLNEESTAIKAAIHLLQIQEVHLLSKGLNGGGEVLS